MQEDLNPNNNNPIDENDSGGNAAKSKRRNDRRRKKTESSGTPQSNPSVDAIRYKTKMCSNWVTLGKCPYGPRCLFAHGEQQLRSCQQNQNFVAGAALTRSPERQFYAMGHFPAFVPPPTFNLDSPSAATSSSSSSTTGGGYLPHSNFDQENQENRPVRRQAAPFSVQNKEPSKTGIWSRNATAGATPFAPRDPQRPLGSPPLSAAIPTTAVSAASVTTPTHAHVLFRAISPSEIGNPASASSSSSSSSSSGCSPFGHLDTVYSSPHDHRTSTPTALLTLQPDLPAASNPSPFTEQRTTTTITTPAHPATAPMTTNSFTTPPPTAFITSTPPPTRDIVGSIGPSPKRTPNLDLAPGPPSKTQSTSCSTTSPPDFSVFFSQNAIRGLRLTDTDSPF